MAAVELDLPPAPNAPKPDGHVAAQPLRLPPSAAHLTAADIEAIGRELDELRQRHLDDRGETDRTYIERIVRWQRGSEIAGRALLTFAWFPPAFVAGAASLGAAKILDNMEIGHNVMHGQYDWMGDAHLHSSAYEWDTDAPSSQWKHGHNVVHHTWTNVVGKDRDVGYGILRMTEQEPWRPLDVLNPVKATLLGLFFQYGVALHELEVERIESGDKPMEEAKPILAAIARKAGAQARKDYLLFPLLAGPGAPFTIAGNVAANLIRNVWAFTIIFCGHFPDGVEQFTPEDLEGETRGRWYLRQMLGSANLTGGPAFHIATGNLSFQIEHHLFPDLPAWRYAAIAEEVEALTEAYDLPYNAGPLPHQFGTVIRRIVRLGLPDDLASAVSGTRRAARRTVRRVSRPLGATLDRLAARGRTGADVTPLSGAPAEASATAA